ncbi:hypothetical protein EU805_02925 [Salipiger sp. IMCC34102]|uniref:SH3 domain-containing protein n=1 Tax=Salipiger sp. IMCC34102 TaxID=2510647 RepID=UPI00101D022F|nr:SH3 domain-containing protein [Salipiger sp. IMCC34102]RYH04338.1 hypothetical protein EU805_02925 [Salipiger sp. IMCC34102]
MYKFMIGTFAILGWAFYVMSGGADFVPEERVASAAPAQVDQAPVQTDASPAVPQDRAVLARADTAPLDQPAPATETDTGPETAVLTEATAQPAEQAPAMAPRTAGSSTDIITTEEPVFASLSGADDTALTANPIREVSARAVNMRDGPGTDFNVIDTLPQGTQAEITASDGTGWVRVFIPGTGMTGWMAERLLTEG